jgi:alkyl sulfatase BDS1-like metallo-beta-lactamase superfamily hydrolase
MDYVEAHDWALSKNAEALVDIHGPGFKGKQAVRQALERARDQLQLIHDQTLRMISLGMDARRAAENVYMPDHMRQGSETYGQVESHVKQVYHGRVGWMGNDVYDINPLAVKEESRRTVELMGGFDKVRTAAGDAAEKGGFENWSWALKLTSMLLELNPTDDQTRSIRATAARALGQRTSSANARGWYITEALAMENKLKLGEQSITLELARELLGTPDVDKIMALPLEDSFQYLRYLVDPRKAQDTRLKFTVMVEGADHPFGIELRNGVIVISEGLKKDKVHLDVTLREWSEFVAGKRSFADRDPLLARFESVLGRTLEPEGTEALDDALEDVVDDMEYFCDGGKDH